MPRSPGNTVPLRGPFQGVKRDLSNRVPPNAAYASLNVLTSRGDIRRRPGLEEFIGTDPAAPSRVPHSILRMLPFYYPAVGGNGPDVVPYVYIVANVDADFPPDPGALCGYAVRLAPGDATYELPHRVIAGQYIDNAGPGARMVYRFGLARLGRAIALRQPAVTGSISLVYKENGATVWVERPLFLPAPGTATVVGAGSGGLVQSQTYQWVMTYCNTLMGTESPASPAVSFTDNAQNFAVDLGIPAIYGPNGVDQVRIYRKQATVDTEYYRVAEIVYGQQGYWRDLGLPATKTKANALDVLASLEPGSGSDLVSWRGRTWLDESPETLYYSDYGTYHAFRLTNSLRIGNGDDDRIRRLLAAQGALFVFKERSVWQVQGSDPASFQSSDLDAPGLASDHALLKVRGVIYYAAHEGLQALSPQSLDCVSGDVEDLWKSFRAIHWRTLAHDPERDLILVHGYQDEARTQELCLAYHIPTQQWHPWELGAGGLGAVGIDLLAAPRLLVHMAGGDHVGELGLLRRDDDAEQMDFAAAAVPWHYDLGSTDFGSKYPKHVSFVGVNWIRDPAARGDALNLEVRTDQAATPIVLSQPDDSPGGQASFTVGRVCGHLGLRIGGTSPHRPRITGIEIEAEGLGQK